MQGHHTVAHHFWWPRGTVCKGITLWRSLVLCRASFLDGELVVEESVVKGITKDEALGEMLQALKDRVMTAAAASGDAAMIDAGIDADRIAALKADGLPIPDPLCFGRVRCVGAGSGA